MTRAARDPAVASGMALFVGAARLAGLRLGGRRRWPRPAGASSLVALFHLVPLVLDAGAIAVLFDRPTARCIAARRAARALGRRVGQQPAAGRPDRRPGADGRAISRSAACRCRDAAGAITVSTTLQALAQIVFALCGVGAARRSTPSSGALTALRAPLLVGTALLSVHRRRRSTGAAARLVRHGMRLRDRGSSGKRDWSTADDRRPKPSTPPSADCTARSGSVAASFALSLLGWFVGTGEVWLALQFLGHPVDWVDALLLESLGQAIRGAAFAIPGSLGVQEGGYLLLAPLVGLPPEAALALSLAKRAREMLLGLPGLVYLHFCGASAGGAALARVPAVDRLARTPHARDYSRRGPRHAPATGRGAQLPEVPAAFRRHDAARTASAHAAQRRRRRSRAGARLPARAGARPSSIALELAAAAEIVLNPRFELGSVLTVHTVADALTRGGDVLLMDADVLYHERIMTALVAGEKPVNRLLIDRDFEPATSR